MAKPLYCDQDGCNNEANILITMLETGEVQAFCGEHAVEYMLHVVLAVYPELMPKEEAPKKKTTRKKKTATPKVEVEPQEVTEG